MERPGPLGYPRPPATEHPAVGGRGPTPMSGHRVRFHLADLVMQVAFWGLVLALIRLFWQAGRGIGAGEGSITDFFVTFVLIELGFVAWVIIHARRKAPACSECGRKFQAPKKRGGPPVC